MICSALGLNGKACADAFRSPPALVLPGFAPKLINACAVAAPWVRIRLNRCSNARAVAPNRAQLRKDVADIRAFSSASGTPARSVAMIICGHSSDSTNIA